jgi:hypothetical protein
MLPFQAAKTVSLTFLHRSPAPVIVSAMLSHATK